jgi:hypothetical protein
MTYQEQTYNKLDTAQKTFIETLVKKQLAKWTRVCPHDLSDHIRVDLVKNKVSSFAQSKVYKNVVAACWALEAKGEIKRNNAGRYIVLEIA